MNEFQSDNTGSYLDVFKSKELRLAFFTGAGLQVCSASFLPYYSRFLLSVVGEPGIYFVKVLHLTHSQKKKVLHLTEIQFSRTFFLMWANQLCRPSNNLLESTP
jgi:hypothetical protein